MWGLVVSIESTYLACLAYAVRGRTNALRGGYRPAARPRSLEGTLVARCGEEWGREGDVWGVWDGLGEVRRSGGKDVSICEERCGCVEKCCVGVWESVGRPKKISTGASVHFSAQNQGKTKKWSNNIS